MKTTDSRRDARTWPPEIDLASDSAVVLSVASRILPRGTISSAGPNARLSGGNGG